MHTNMYSFLLGLVTAIVVISHADACTCQAPDPNVTMLCDSYFNFAAKVRVKSSEVKSTDPTDGYIQYKLKILYLYKASGAYSRRNYFLDSPTNGGFCGISLEVDEVYYLIGRASGKNELSVNSCNWYKKKDLTSLDEIAYLESWEGDCCRPIVVINPT